MTSARAACIQSSRPLPRAARTPFTFQERSFIAFNLEAAGGGPATRFHPGTPQAGIASGGGAAKLRGRP
jgi:hypothetical protein